MINGVKVTQHVPQQDSTMTGLLVDSEAVQSLGQKKIRATTPRKGNYRAKRPSQSGERPVSPAPSIQSYKTNGTSKDLSD